MSRAVISVRSTKGGVGKSSVALLLGIGARMAGKDAIIVDLDVAGTDLADLPIMVSDSLDEAGDLTVYSWLAEPAWEAGKDIEKDKLPWLRFEKIRRSPECQVLRTVPQLSPAETRERRRVLMDLTSQDTPFLRHRLASLIQACARSFKVIILDLEPFGRDLPATVLECVQDMATNGSPKIHHQPIIVMSTDWRDILSTLKPMYSPAVGNGPRPVFVLNCLLMAEPKSVDDLIRILGTKIATMDAIEPDSILISRLVDAKKLLMDSKEGQMKPFSLPRLEALLRLTNVTEFPTEVVPDSKKLIATAEGLWKTVSDRIIST